MQVSVNYTVAPEGEGQLRSTPCRVIMETKDPRGDSPFSPAHYLLLAMGSQVHGYGQKACSACCQAVLQV